MTSDEPSLCRDLVPWDLVPLKYLLDSVDQGVSPQAEARLADEPGSWGVLKTGCVNYGTFRQEEHKRLPRSFLVDKSDVVAVGDIIVSRASGSPHLVGSAAMVNKLDYSLILSDKHFRLRPAKGTDAHYLVWLLNSHWYRTQVRQAISGAEGLANNMPKSALRAFQMPLPSVDNQRQIVDFLNRETAQIDALIAKQEELIYTLRERRQAVLNREFDSIRGNRVQLRRGIRFLTSGSRGWGEYYADDGERFLRIGNLPRTTLTVRGDIQYVRLPSGVTEGSRTRLQRKDLLFSITAYLGSVAVVGNEWIGAYVSQHVALCRLDLTRFDERFVGYFMLATEGQDQLKLAAAGGTKVQLALDDIKATSVPMVSLKTQRETVASIERQLSKIDALIAKAQEFNALACERRAALITDAVTGKIDVSTGTARERT